MARKHSKHGRNDWADEPEEAEAPPTVPCWLCGRPTGSTIVWHHKSEEHTSELQSH